MPELTDDVLLKILHSARGKPLAVKDLVARGHLDARPADIVRHLRALERSGQVIADGDRYRLAPPPAPEKPSVSAPLPGQAPFALPRPVQAGGAVGDGSLSVHRDGYGFIRLVDGGDDVFVPASIRGDALDGDLVRAHIGTGRDGRKAAKSLEVLQRRRTFAVGVYQESRDRGRRVAYVEPRDQKLGNSFSVLPAEGIAPGTIVRVRLDAGLGGLSGVVVDAIGKPGDPDAEVLSVAFGQGFSDTFPPDALHAAESTPAIVTEADRAGRRDLRNTDLVTIDGEDARDFDDAVFVEKVSHGWRLVVAIADVTHYVVENGALDQEALKRATSVYFPRHVLPMLPERLSNGICSLNPGVERLCMVADMVINAEAKVVDVEIYPGVMKSKARCTYTQVAKLVAGEDVPELAHVRDMLLLATDLSKKMTGVRIARGAIDFDLPEGQINLDAAGKVTSIVRRARNPAHRLVEEFMLAANEAVAHYFESRDLPTMFRVHGKPKEEKLKAFLELAAVFGHKVKVDKDGVIGPGELNALLTLIEDRPEKRALNELLLRSMMQAVYSSENVGHFGLAAESYLHFTSPIRRYPDLIVHRLLKKHRQRGGTIPPEPERRKEAEKLEQTALHCSERERASSTCEREIDSYYAAMLMKEHIGERFSGIVASVAEFGLFVELDDPYVQGLVKAESLGQTARVDEKKRRLIVGPMSYGVGDSIEVEVADADPVMRRIELRPAGIGLAGGTADPQKPVKFLADAVRELRQRQGSRPSTRTSDRSDSGRRHSGSDRSGAKGGRGGKGVGGGGRGSEGGKGSAGKGGRGGAKPAGGKPGGGKPGGGGRGGGKPRRGR